MNRLFTLVVICFIQLSMYAQIPVADEPLHHVIHEDDEVRILEIIAVPGDTAQMHQHDYNYCYIAVKGGKMWLEDQGEDSRTVALPDYYCGGKFDLENNPFVHRFANIDTSEIQFFTIEHKSGLASLKRSKENLDHVILENELFRVRKLEIAPLSSLELGHDGNCFLLNLDATPKLFSSDRSVPYWEHVPADEMLLLSNLSEQAILIGIFEIY